MPSRRWTAALGVLVLGILVSQLFAVLGTSAEDDPLATMALFTVGVEGFIAALAVAGALLGASAVRGLGLTPGRLAGRDVALLAVGTLALSHALDGILHVFGLAQDSVLGEFPALLEGARGARLVLALLAFGVVPAIAEELLCRGLVQGVLVRRFGAGLGVAGSAIVFGVLHVEPVHAAFAAVLGLYLGTVAHWAGSSRPAILCHGANNLAAVAFAAASVGPPTSLSTVAGGLAIAAACAWRVGRRSAAPPPSVPAAIARPERKFPAGS